MSDGVAAAPSACWNCRQPLTAGATRCIWCGVTLTADAPPLVVAPVGIPGAAPAIAPAPVAGPARAARPALAGGGAAGPSTLGTSASAGLRVVAVTVDVVLLVVAGIAAFLLLRSAPLTAAVLAELLLLLWILDARTGATPGKALVRLRTARSGTALSPGAGRSLGSGALHGAGLLVGVGPWVVAASAAFDRSRRSWADRATGTVTVVVPPARPLPAGAPLVVGSPSAPAAPPAPGASGTGLVLPPLPGAPTIPPVAAPSPLAEPRVVSVAPRRSVIDEESASAGIPASAPPAAVAPSPAPVPPSAATPDDARVSLLLVFDTGQRASLAAPVAVNLGRNPTATAEGDRLLAVDDPESTVSKTHARLEHSRGTTWITDGGSTNGSEILSDEGEVTPLAPGVRTLLGDGDRVRIGHRVFTVSVVLDGGAG